MLLRGCTMPVRGTLDGGGRGGVSDLAGWRGLCDLVRGRDACGPALVWASSCE